MNKRKFILASMGIFLAGALAGAVGMGVYAKARLSPMVRMEKMGPAAFFLDRLDHVLKLSSEQKQAIKPIIEDTVAKLREVREPCLRNEDGVLKEEHDRLKSYLDPAQQEKFDEFLAKMKERRKRFFGH